MAKKKTVRIKLSKLKKIPKRKRKPGENVIMVGKRNKDGGRKVIIFKARKLDKRKFLKRSPNRIV